ncbi:RNA-binding protein 24 [Cocos nucifera]|nr:RNA-binding protein 24 [Cocos nucifera]
MASSGPSSHRSRFGDTTLTKVFVGGLAWETPTEELRRYFEQFGEILEAVIITDKNTGRSKGYGFVTFRDPDSARLSVADPNPVIGGRRANCNIASMGRPRPSPPRVRSQVGSLYQGPPQAVSPPYSRVPAQMPPPPPVLYPTHFGYLTYPTDYGYQLATYNPQMTPHYYHQMYGSSSSPVGPSYHYPHMGYTVPTSRASFSSTLQNPRPPFMQYPTVQMEGSISPSSSQPYTFQLQPPPHVRRPPNTIDSPASQQPTTTVATSEGADA